MPSGPVPGRRRFTGAFFLGSGFGVGWRSKSSQNPCVLRGIMPSGPYPGRRRLGMPSSHYLAVFVVFYEGFVASGRTWANVAWGCPEAPI